MSIPLIRAALEKRLALLAPAIATAYENSSYNSTGGVPYQRVTFLPAAPDNSIMGSFMYKEQGLYQVMLCYPISTGPGLAEARAQALRLHFRRGTTLYEGSLIINIVNTSRVVVGSIDGDRFCIPIFIPWQCYVTT
jgi:hypothetical protein